MTSTQCSGWAGGAEHSPWPCCSHGTDPGSCVVSQEVLMLDSLHSLGVSQPSSFAWGGGLVPVQILCKPKKSLSLKKKPKQIKMQKYHFGGTGEKLKSNNDKRFLAALPFPSSQSPKKASHHPAPALLTLHGINPSRARGWCPAQGHRDSQSPGAALPGAPRALPSL